LDEEAIRLKKLIFQLLMTSESRTTDLLELIASDTMKAVIVKQEHTDSMYELRESYLIAERSWMPVSQNLAILYPERIPEQIYRRIAVDGEGIGHVLRGTQVPNRRELLHYGWRNVDEIVDLFGKPYRLQFHTHPQIPYKEYTISFFSDQRIGIHLLEYFNPELISSQVTRDPIACHESTTE